MITMIDDVQIRMAIKGQSEWTVGCYLLANLIKKKKNGLHCKTRVKRKCLSTECPNVEHDDYRNRRCTNYNDDQRIMLLDNGAGSLRFLLRFRQQ